MKYRVRNKDGELEYESFSQLEEAARVGFVEPNDELLREGETEWKKASTLISRPGRKIRISSIAFWTAFAVLLALFSLWTLASGDYLLGGLPIFMLVMVLLKVTTKAARRKQ